jgi:hypothetical protein
MRRADSDVGLTAGGRQPSLHALLDQLDNFVGRLVPGQVTEWVDNSDYAAEEDVLPIEVSGGFLRVEVSSCMSYKMYGAGQA